MAQERTTSGLLVAVAAAAGALLGFLSARVVLVGSGLSLVPWALTALALGACARSRSAAAATGAVFGFALAFTFMTAGYDGAAPLHTRLLPFCLFGVVGAVCGTALATAGFLVGRRARAKDRAR